MADFAGNWFASDRPIFPYNSAAFSFFCGIRHRYTMHSCTTVWRVWSWWTKPLSKSSISTSSVSRKKIQLRRGHFTTFSALWTPTHTEIPRLWQGCGNLVTRLLHKVVISCPQPWNNFGFETVSTLWQPCKNLAATLLRKSWNSLLGLNFSPEFHCRNIKSKVLLYRDRNVNWVFLKWSILAMNFRQQECNQTQKKLLL